MQPRFHSILTTSLIVVIALVSTPALARYTVVSELLEPAKITMGHSALLTITTLGDGTESPILPFVGGLELHTVSQSHRTDSIKKMTLTTTIVRVTPHMAGSFSIAGLAVNIDPILLTVEPEHRVDDTVPVPPNGVRLAPVVARPLNSSGIQLMADGAAFVRLNVPTTRAYVGESIPIDIEVGMRVNEVTSLNGLPTLTGGDFTLNNLSRQPERSERTIDGKPFGLFTWHSVMAAVKPGIFTFSVEVPLTVKFSLRPRAESRLDDLLGDPFLQNHFGPSVTKQTKVASPPSTLMVAALPTANRPANFHGAVGTFQISTDMSPIKTAPGDPLTVRLHIIGSGNFDRVDSPMLPSANGWKTYPPKSTFKAADAIGYGGEKLFEQPVIVSTPAVQSLPGIDFSFFDPKTGRYTSLRSPPLPLPAANRAEASPSRKSLSLRADHVVRKAVSDSLLPLYLQPPFLAGSSLLALAFGGAWICLRRRPTLARTGARLDRGRLRAIAEVSAQLDAAARAGDGARYFAVARDAIPPADRSAPDIAGLFTRADEVHYDGKRMNSAEFSHCTRVILEHLGREPAR